MPLFACSASSCVATGIFGGFRLVKIGVAISHFEVSNLCFTLLVRVHARALGDHLWRDIKITPHCLSKMYVFSDQSFMSFNCLPSITGVNIKWLGLIFRPFIVLINIVINKNTTSYHKKKKKRKVDDNKMRFLLHYLFFFQKEVRAKKEEHLLTHELLYQNSL